jgi:hypothetical protein
MRLRIPIEKLAEHCRDRAPGFAEAVRAASAIEAGAYVISHEEWTRLVRQHLVRPPAARPGLGDVVHAILKPLVRGTRLENCSSCAQRREWLNQIGK